MWHFLVFLSTSSLTAVHSSLVNLKLVAYSHVFSLKKKISNRLGKRILNFPQHDPIDFFSTSPTSQTTELQTQVRVCGCPRMIFFRTSAHVFPPTCTPPTETSTMTCFPNTLGRTVHLPQINLTRGLVLDTARKTGIHNRRRPVLFLFRISTASMRYSLCGERGRGLVQHDPGPPLITVFELS